MTRHPNSVPSSARYEIAELATSYFGEPVVVIEVMHGNTGNVIAMPYVEAAKLRAALNAMVLIEQDS